jgi:peptidoglycan/xylan/chitin deacetylase (PgdA/CDA1 family)
MEKPALISLTFDDGLRCQFERAVPILNQHGLPATFFLTANTAPAHVDWCAHPDWPKITWSESDIQSLKDLIKRRHEIGSHSVWHKFPEPGHPLFHTDFNPQFEAEESKRLIEGWLGEKISSFCYPFCRKPDSLKSAVIAARYRQARAGATGFSYYSPQEPIDLFDLDCRLIRANENVRDWMRPDRWHILMFHGIGSEQDGWEPITEAEFARQMRELAELRASGAVEVVTFKDGADRLRGKFVS